MIIRASLIAFMLVTSAGTLLSAEVIRLVTGEVIIGEVLEASFDSVTLSSEFPRVGTTTFAADQVSADSLYAILSRSIPETDATGRMALTEFSLERGLFALAIVEARKVKVLDPSKEARCVEIEDTAWESIASGLLDEAKTHIAIDSFELARLYLKSVVDRYPTTKAAKESKRLLNSIRKKGIERSEPPARLAASKDALRKRLVRAQKMFDKVEARTGGLQRHFKGTKDNEQFFRRAEPYYRKVYGLVRVPTANQTDDSTLNKELRELATVARSRLTKAYLELGTLYLSRGAIQLADTYCSRACEVEPENKENHDLHKLITEARIAQRFGY